jgi:hypothetical protein
MKLLKKRVTPITLISGEDIHFIIQEGSGGGQISEPVPLGPFLADEVDASVIPDSFLEQPDSVMIVPDYWLGNTSFPFQSKKRALAEAFLERKLQDEFHEVPGIKDFFEHFFYETDQGETMLYAYFVREPAFFHLYETLARCKLSPRRITTPAFLWESNLREEIADFAEGGKAFVHSLAKECYLYFFFRGHFLFSRQITLPDFEEDASDQLETLAYETNQSLYLFSQKAKAEIDRVYMASCGYVDAAGLAEKLGREVEEVEGLEEALTEEAMTSGLPGVLRAFILPDLSRFQKYLSICHRQIEKEQQWKPVQKMGIAVGLILLLLLAGESVLLWKWSKPVGLQAGQGRGAHQTEAARALREYNEALDLFLKESRRPSASKTIIDLARAMPEQVWIKEMVVESEPSPGVVLKGTVRAERPGQFTGSLSDFLDSLNNHFQGARSLGLQDIDFDTNDCRAQDGYHTCAIALEFSLP